mgnify:CR=1 FL=1
MPKSKSKNEGNCGLCGCALLRMGKYGEDNALGRCFPSEHHLVAKRFYGKNKNKRSKILDDDDFKKFSNEKIKLCYDCHEELLHNPVLSPDNMKGFKELVRKKHWDERNKKDGKEKIRGRIKLLQEIIDKGINIMLYGKIRS